jgi:hypothetical protein
MSKARGGGERISRGGMEPAALVSGAEGAGRPWADAPSPGHRQYPDFLAEDPCDAGSDLSDIAVNASSDGVRVERRGIRKVSVLDEPPAGRERQDVEESIAIRLLDGRIHQDWPGEANGILQLDLQAHELLVTALAPPVLE